MFVFTKGPGRPARFRFYWWPLLLGIAISVILTVVLNSAR